MRASTLITSSKPTGNKPIRCSDLSGLPLSTAERETKVMSEQMVVEMVTQRMRPLITDGASREMPSEGRVVGER